MVVHVEAELKMERTVKSSRKSEHQKGGSDWLG